MAKNHKGTKTKAQQKAAQKKAKRAPPHRARSVMSPIQYAATTTHALLASPTRKIDPQQVKNLQDLLYLNIARIEAKRCTFEDVGKVNNFLLSLHMMVRKEWAQDEDDKIANAGLECMRISEAMQQGHSFTPDPKHIGCMRECVSDFSEFACELTEREFANLGVAGNQLLIKTRRQWSQPKVQQLAQELEQQAQAREEAMQAKAAQGGAA